jgi:hypothetical protein
MLFDYIAFMANFILSYLNVLKIKIVKNLSLLDGCRATDNCISRLDPTLIGECQCRSRHTDGFPSEQRTTTLVNGTNTAMY